jgi:hypothetical protein
MVVSLDEDAEAQSGGKHHLHVFARQTHLKERDFRIPRPGTVSARCTPAAHEDALNVSTRKAAHEGCCLL